MEEDCSFDHPGHKEPDVEITLEAENFDYTYEYLKELDPIAANRIHPNDRRKITQYLSLYARFGILPSKLLQEKAMELNADYTRGLRQAIGVREFADFLGCYISESKNGCEDSNFLISADKTLKEDMHQILDTPTPSKNHLKVLLTGAIERVKLNTRRLVRRQKRRLGRLQMLFGWNIHFVDATESILCFSDDSWATQVVEPACKIINSFLHDNACPEEPRNGSEEMKVIERDLWTQHVCEACGNKVLRGAHEWEQHRQGRSHRKGISRLKKSGSLLLKGDNHIKYCT